MAEPDQSSDKPATVKLRFRFRYSLRTLFLFVTIAAVAAFFYARRPNPGNVQFYFQQLTDRDEALAVISFGELHATFEQRAFIVARLKLHPYGVPSPDSNDLQADNEVHFKTPPIHPLRPPTDSENAVDLRCWKLKIGNLPVRLTAPFSRCKVLSPNGDLIDVEDTKEMRELLLKAYIYERRVFVFPWPLASIYSTQLPLVDPEATGEK